MTVDSRIIELYNEYVHSALPRREFLKRLANIAGGVAAATTLLAVLEPNYAQARQTEPDDKRLKTERIEFRTVRSRRIPLSRARSANATRSPACWSSTKIAASTNT